MGTPILYYRARNSLGLTSDTRVTFCRHAAKYRRRRRRTRSSLEVVFSPSPWTVLKLIRMRAQHDYTTSFVIVSRLPRKIHRWYSAALILQLTSKFYLEQNCPSDCGADSQQFFDPAQLSIRIFCIAGRWLDGLALPIRFSIRSHRSSRTHYINESVSIDMMSQIVN